MKCSFGKQFSNSKWWIFYLVVVAELAYSAPIEKEKAVEKEKKEEKTLEKELLTLQRKLPDQTSLTGETKQMIKSEVLAHNNKGGDKIPVAGTNQDADRPFADIPQGNGYDVLNSPAIDLTPQAVAEYLILTGDFDGLDMALLDLVRSQVLSPYEVEQYKDAVGVKYEKMLQQVLDAEASYMQAFNMLYSDLPSLEDGQTRDSEMSLAKSIGALKDDQNPQANNNANVVVSENSVDSGLIGNEPVRVEQLSPAEEHNDGSAESGEKDLEKLLVWINAQMEKEMKHVKEAKTKKMDTGSFDNVEEQQLEYLNNKMDDDQPSDNQWQKIAEIKAELEKEEMAQDKASVSGKSGKEQLENRDSQGNMATKEITDEVSP